MTRSYLHARAILLCPLLLALGACDNTSATPIKDAGADAARDASPSGDHALQPDATVADSGSVDANFVDPYAGRPLGQCKVSADCPDNAGGAGSCNADSPGGLCRMCGNNTHCPGSTECNSYGTCSQPCNSGNGEADCPPGMTCASAGLCRILSCVGNVCPVPLYTCSDSNLCRRYRCDEGCPQGTTCLQAVCVERRQ